MLLRAIEAESRPPEALRARVVNSGETARESPSEAWIHRRRTAQPKLAARWSRPGTGFIGGKIG